jgi:choline dehydrogenase
MQAFDYIVVGAGSAGCVLAARLSEDPHCTVLLLEAGGPDTPKEIRIPAAFSKLFRSEWDWAYYTEPQVHAAGRRLYWPRGRVLGGCSSINAMIYMRGLASDYDGWEALGNPGWGWNDVQRYFLRMEDFAASASEHFGHGGPLAVNTLRTKNPLSRAFVEAAAQAGWPRCANFNSGHPLGAGFYQVTQRRGQRCSAADAYLAPARSRVHLRVETGALALKLLVERARVTGVRYAQGQAVHEARAAREVILCGGTVNSPQLLLLSGIGPGDDLRRQGIAVAADLPGVGANLHDHPAIGVCYASKKPVSLSTAESLRNLLRYVLLRSGPLASNGAEAGAFVKSRPDLPGPDLQFHFGPVLYVDHGLSLLRPHGFTLAPALVRPRSRGHLKLQSSDPAAPPAIDPHYLAAPEDERALREGVRLARDVARQPAFDPFRGEELLPGRSSQDDSALSRFVRERVETLYHPVGTCKMGSDSQAVVDARLRVHGVEGLRVADASVMPEIVSGNTNAPVMMMAEKAADMVRGIL